jgi:KDO2-lipid IV(A) lauroyltransferase
MFYLFMYRIIQIFALLLPVRVSYRVAEHTADVYSFLSTRDRKAVISNLKIVLNRNDGDIEILARDVFRNFAKYMVDFFRFPKLDRAFIDKHVKIENIHYVDDTLSKGRGMIAVTAHLGNWELAGAVAAIMGYPVTAVALPQKDRSVNRLFVRQRTIKGVKVVSVGVAVRKCYEVLKNNGIVAVLGDRDFTNSGVQSEFFKKKAFLPKGPAAFCISTGSPVVPGFLVREEGNNFRLIFEKPIECAYGSRSDDALREVVGEIAAVIEKYVRMYPTQWLIFRSFWDI